MAISTRCSPAPPRSPSRSGERVSITFADQARLSRTLVILDTHVPLDVPLAETLVRQPEAETLLSFLRRLEFSHLAPPHRRRSRRRGARRCRTCAGNTAEEEGRLRPPAQARTERRLRHRADRAGLSGEGRLAFASCRRACGQARRASLRPQQIRDDCPSRAPCRAARRSARSGPCRLSRQGHFGRSDARASLSAWRLPFAPDRRPTFRSPTVQPTSSISAAKRARGSRCARRSIC